MAADIFAVASSYLPCNGGLSYCVSSMNILFAHLIVVVVADLAVTDADLFVAVAPVVVVYVHYVDPFLYVFFGNFQIQFKQSFLLFFSIVLSCS